MGEEFIYLGRHEELANEDDHAQDAKLAAGVIPVDRVVASKSVWIDPRGQTRRVLRNEPPNVGIVVPNAHAVVPRIPVVECTFPPQVPRSGRGAGEGKRVAERSIAELVVQLIRIRPDEPYRVMDGIRHVVERLERRASRRHALRLPGPLEWQSTYRIPDPCEVARGINGD